MNLTKNLRGKIIEQFKRGYEIAELVKIYGKEWWMIEDVIRSAVHEEPKENQLDLKPPTAE